MAESVDCSEFCRLCLVKEQVNTHIFEELGELQQIHVKITACLPIKVAYEDSLPKRICDDCIYKLDQQYQFWNTTVNSEKQLKQWLSIVDEPTPKQETEKNKIKKEKEQEPTVTKTRPRRNARRKAAQNVRLAAAAAIAASDSDAGIGGDDMEIDHFAKEENDSDEDYHDNTESLEENTYTNVGLDSEEQAEAGPSGLQKSGAVASANSGSDNGGAGNTCGNYKNDQAPIKQDPGDFEPFVQITEFPEKKNLENVISKLKNPTDSEDDDAPLVKLTTRRGPQPIETRKKTNRKKTVPKKVNLKKLSEIEDDTEDEDYVPSKYSKRNKKSKNGDLEGGIKEEVEEEDGYQNPFNYGYHFITTPARKRKPFNKNTKSTTKTSKSKWSCLICLADLETKDALIAHYSLHKEDPIKQEDPNDAMELEFLQCQICGHIVDTDKELRKHSETHREQKFHCDICDAIFEKAYDLSLHSRTHSEEPLLKCELCDFETIYQNQLKTHQERHDTDYKFKCEICNKGFFIQSWYDEHKNFHTGAKPFICDVCEKPFAYTRYLTAHKRAQHPESYRDEPIVNECLICSKRFAHRKSLMLHMRGHTGENTVLCDICGKRLSSNEHLKFHRRIHTGYKPYKCDVCTKGFAKKCNLTLHLRVHSGEKPYVCDVCGKCFSQRSTLVIHERYHTGSRPYTCHLCHKGFVAKGVLSIHLKSCSRNTIMSNIIE